MVSYLDVRAAGATIEPRTVGPARDTRAQCPPTDGVLHAVGPASSAAIVRQAITERRAIADRVFGGEMPAGATPYGTCAWCEQPMENYYAGPCPLCRAALQKLRKEREDEHKDESHLR